jgi:hypothetical protein
MRTAAGFVACSLLLAALAACGDGAATGGGGRIGDPVGTWVLDAAKTRESAFAMTKRQIADTRKRLADAPPEVRQKMEAQFPKDDEALRRDIEAKTGRLTVELVLKPGGASRLHMKGVIGAGLKEETQDGTWAERGEDVVVAPKTRNGEAFSGHEQRFARKEGRLVFLDPGGNELYWLERKKE